ncbi:MAG: hypothetical protein H6719_26235 [Sandaracinaceae bacterium]|nr:hypothetical protein [Sandaracinaceae bacterium]
MSATLDREELDLGATTIGHRRVGTVTLTAGDHGITAKASATAPFSLSGASTVDLEAGASAVLSVVYEPSEAGTHEGSLQVVVLGRGDLADLTITCAVRGACLDRPVVDNDLAALDLGACAVGGSQSGAINVRVPPLGTTRRLSVRTEGDAELAVTPASLLIPSGAAGTVVVTFEPGAVRTYAATLCFGYDDDGEERRLEVDLTGEGVADEDAERAAAAAEDEAADPDGPRQRAALYVPHEDSLVSLGAPYVDGDETLSHSGFSATSTAHVFFRAAKAATVQANGTVWFQSSAGSTYALAGHDGYFVGATQLIAGAGNLLAIAGGFPIDDPVDADQDTAEPGDPVGVADLGVSFLVSDLIFGLTSTAISVANRLKQYQQFTAHEEWKDRSWKGVKKVLNVTQFVGWMGYAMFSTLSFIADRVTGLPAFTLSMTGAAGVLSGTPALHRLSGMSVNLSSLYGTNLLGLASVSIEGGYVSQVDSIWGQTRVTAGRTLNFVAGGEVKAVSRFATLSLTGATVRIGDMLPDLLQLPTVKTSILALAEVQLASMALVALRGVGAPGVSKIEAKVAKAEHVSLARTLLKVGPYEIACDPAGITISGATGQLLHVSGMDITFGPSGGQVMMTPAAVDLGGGTLMLSTSGIFSTAPRVDLG